MHDELSRARGALPASVRHATALFRLLVLLLPWRLGRRGRAMVGMFRVLALESWREGGGLAVWRTWFAAAGDLLIRLPREYVGPGRAAGGGQIERRVIMSKATTFLTEMRIAWRSLLRRPALSVMAVLTLGLGIGAATAVFSVAWGSWLKPLPYPDAGQLVLLTDRHKSFDPGVGGASISIGNYWEEKENARLFESMAAFSHGGVQWGTEGRRISALFVEPGFFRTLRMPFSMGRAFEESDIADGGRVLILSNQLWRREFDGDRSVIGRQVTVNGEAWTVIGVTPADFEFRWESDVIRPYIFTDQQKSQHGGRSIRAIGRIAPGVSIEAARSDLQSIYSGIAERYPQPHEGWTAWASSLREYVVGDDHRVILLMCAAVALLLLATFVNVAGLMLTRAESRQQEVAVRCALGAGRGRVVGVFLTESLAVGVTGGLVGVAVAYGGIGLLIRIFGASLRRPSEIGLNVSTLAVALVLTLVTSLLIGLVPALRTDPAALMVRLRSATVRGRLNTGMRRILVTAEVALAVVLVCGAALLAGTVWRLTHADLGFRPEGAMSVSFDLPDRLADDQSARDLFFRQVLEGLDGHPAIAAAAATDRIPPDGNISINGVQAAGRPETSTDFVVVRYATTDYFAAAGIPLLEGSSFEGWIDDLGEGGLIPVVINRPLADALFPGGTAVGGALGGGPTRVIGVAGAVREQGAHEPAPPAMYLPWPATSYRGMGAPLLIVRAAADIGALAPALREVVAGIDPDVKFTASPIIDRLGGFYSAEKFAVSLMSLFASVALVLGAIGIYGILSWTVAQRTREVGVRIALGADRSTVVRMVTRQGLQLGVAGVVVGLVAAGGLSRFLRSLLYEISAVDPATYAAVAVLFIATAGLACWIPAHRASRIEPTEALKTE